MDRSDKTVSFAIKPIGYIAKKNDDPCIVLDAQYKQGLKQVKQFSHIHVFWWAHQNDAASLKQLVTKPPYVHNKEFGVFACRAEYRPNPIMVTICMIKSIDEKNGIIVVDDMDAFGETPVIDIKPYIPVCDRVEKVKVPDSHKCWPSWYEVEFDPADADFDSSGASSNGADEDYPTTGRIGRLAKKIVEQTDSATVKGIFHDWNQYKSKMSKSAGSEWIEQLMGRLEEKVGQEKAWAIMYQCGEECFASVDMIKKVAKELSSKKLTINEFIDNQNKKFGKYTRYSLAEDGAILLEQFSCQCMIKHAKKVFSKSTYCHCGIGCRERFFTVALGKKAKVLLLESRATGGTSCKFKVITE